MNDALDLLILDAGAPDRAVAYAQYDADTAVRLIPCQAIAQLRAFSQRLNRVSNGEDQRPTPQELGTYGNDLFRLVLRDDLLDLYNRLPSDYIRLRIMCNQPDIQALAWEYLQQPGTPTGPNNMRGVVRIVPTIGQAMPKPRKLTRKVRVLFAFADPIDQGPVRWQAIHDTIKQKFASRAGGSFELDVVEAASIQALAQALLRKRYDILHFNGHGAVVVGADGVQRGHLTFVDAATQRSQQVSAEQLAMLITGRKLQLVILSSCNSSAGDFTRNYAVVAESLVRRGVPAVVANQFALPNDVAATFAIGFYGELVKTGDVDRAVSAGRLMLAVQNRLPERAVIEWGIPTLYRHVGAAGLFSK